MELCGMEKSCKFMTHFILSFPLFIHSRPQHKKNIYLGAMLPLSTKAGDDFSKKYSAAKISFVVV
jgi:hypothetical protein